MNNDGVVIPECRRFVIPEIFYRGSIRQHEDGPPTEDFGGDEAGGLARRSPPQADGGGNDGMGPAPECLYRGLFENFEAVGKEIQMNIEMTQEIKAQEAINGAFGWQVVTNNFQVLNLVSKSAEAGYDNHRDVNHPASSCNLDFMGAFNGIDPNPFDCFIGNHRVSRTCIYGQFQYHGGVAVKYFGVANKDSDAMIQIDSFHNLESGCVAFRKRIRGISNVDVFPFGELEHFSIDLVSVGAVEKKPPRDGRGCRFIHFVNLDQKPFAVEPASDNLELFRFNFGCFFGFHVDHLVSDCSFSTDEQATDAGGEGFVIPECLSRGSRGCRFPTENFGNDDLCGDDRFGKDCDFTLMNRRREL